LAKKQPPWEGKAATDTKLGPSNTKETTSAKEKNKTKQKKKEKKTQGKKGMGLTAP